jgi:glutamine amidotransferase
VPHAGWNSLEVRVPHPIFDGIKKHVDFYFVHSFYYKCDDDEMILSKTDYGDRFVSSVFRDNVVGLQFHPEKSQSNGLKIIENFCDWDCEC